MMQNDSLTINRKLTPADKEKLTAAFLEMYEGLVKTNLSQDKTLGQSMYNAMQHEKMYVESKQSNDIATIYLRQIQAFYAVAQSQQSMTDPNRDKKQQFKDDAERKTFKTAAENQTKTGIKSIDAIIAEFSRANEKVTQPQAKPIIKTAQENRDQLPKTLENTPRAPQHGPQLPGNDLISIKQLPAQNPHKADDYGAAKPRTAFKEGTTKVQQRGRDFENIKKLQQALIQYMQYQKQYQKAA